MTQNAVLGSVRSCYPFIAKSLMEANSKLQMSDDFSAALSHAERTPTQTSNRDNRIC